MKNKKHLQTNYFKFVIERHLEDPDTNDGVERPLPDDDENFAQRKINEIDDEIELPEEEQTETSDNEEEDDLQLLIKDKKRLEALHEYLRYRHGRK